MSCLYHYCSNEKCFSILKGKTIRLSDIEKSNDYMNIFLRLLSRTSAEENNSNDYICVVSFTIFICRFSFGYELT